MLEGWEPLDFYYLSNKFWIAFNVFLIVPFIFSCLMRFFNPDVNKPLWTDHIARFLLTVSWVFYIFDMAAKYPIDGAHTICEKAFFIHHGSSLLILPPLILNKYIPWWVSPIGFMHGFCIYYPQYEFINYIYAVCLFIFHYGIYQEPYCKFKGYGITRFFMNFIWIFALMLLLGNCSNYLPTAPDQ